VTCGGSRLLTAATCAAISWVRNPVTSWEKFSVVIVPANAPEAANDEAIREADIRTGRIAIQIGPLSRNSYFRLSAGSSKRDRL
jgi:hypothetical protein